MKKFASTKLLHMRFDEKNNDMLVFWGRGLRRTAWWFLNLYGRLIQTQMNKRNARGRVGRKLEIGPGNERITGFETLNVVWGKNVDYVADASKSLPFCDRTFEIVYASHVLEHIPWYMVDRVFEEWVRVLTSGGVLEVWVPNGLLIAKTFVEVEEGGANNIHMDGWYRYNDTKDPCLWVNGRIFSYGDGSGAKSHQNWHMCVFSPRYLKLLFEKNGLVDVEQMNSEDVRGYDHGWINLGFRGKKP